MFSPDKNGWIAKGPGLIQRFERSAALLKEEELCGWVAKRCPAWVYNPLYPASSSGWRRRWTVHSRILSHRYWNRKLLEEISLSQLKESQGPRTTRLYFKDLMNESSLFFQSSINFFLCFYKRRVAVVIVTELKIKVLSSGTYCFVISLIASCAAQPPTKKEGDQWSPL